MRIRNVPDNPLRVVEAPQWRAFENRACCRPILFGCAAGHASSTVAIDLRPRAVAQVHSIAIHCFASLTVCFDLSYDSCPGMATNATSSACNLVRTGTLGQGALDGKTRPFRNARVGRSCRTARGDFEGKQFSILGSTQRNGELGLLTTLVGQRPARVRRRRDWHTANSLSSDWNLGFSGQKPGISGLQFRACCF